MGRRLPSHDGQETVKKAGRDQVFLKRHILSDPTSQLGSTP